MSEDTRNNLIKTARLAEQAERYDDMVDAMTKVTELGAGLNSEERNLLSVAYKNIVGARRSAWKIISSIESRNEERETSEADQKPAKDFKKKIESELEQKCLDIIGLLDKYIIPSTEKAGQEDVVEAKVFFLKMKGDYYRYLVEIYTADARKNNIELSRGAYQKATDEAASLPNTHPIKLGLALNFSVFHYEIMSSGKSACELAQKAFDDAMGELDSLKDDSYKDSTLIMQLLRDNLTLWTESESQE